MSIFPHLFRQQLSPRRASVVEVTGTGLGEEDSLMDCNLELVPPASMGTQPPDAPTCGRTQLFFAGLVFSICLLLFIFLPANDLLRQVVELQRENPATYVFTYIVAGLLVPAPLLSVLAGVLLGPSIQAVIVILCGSLGAACFAFTISRFLLRQFVLKHFVQRSKQLKAIDVALRTNSVKLVLCARMVLPFTFNNYFLGTTSVKATTFALATFVTGIPFAILYSIIGGELPSLDGALSAESFTLKSTEVSILGYYTVSKRHLEITGIFASVCFCVFLVRTAKQFSTRVIAEAQQEIRS